MNTYPIPPFRTNRKVIGMSAILLPMLETGGVDWKGFDDHLNRTWEAGLTPAVNMDTGFANLIDEATRTQALQRSQRLSHGRSFVAGAFVGDQPGSPYARDPYHAQVDQILERGGLPIIFQSFGLTNCLATNFSMPIERLEREAVNSWHSNWEQCSPHSERSIHLKSIRSS